MKCQLVCLSLFVSACATPVTGEMSLTGGAKDERVSDSTYVISASLNGFTPAAALKPTILQRAKRIAKDQGFAGFEIQWFGVSLFIPDNKYSARAEVHFLRDTEPELIGRRYPVDSSLLAPYQPDIDAAKAAALATLRSHRGRDAKGVFVSLEPAFIDAVSSSEDLWDGTSTTILRPGIASFAVYAIVQEGFVGGSGTALLHVDAVLEPGKTYALVGRFDGGRLEYWLEDLGSKRQVTAPRAVSVSLK